MKILTCCTVLFFISRNTANGWKKYAENVEMSRPNQDGIYEFDMKLEFRLSMSFADALGRLSLVDYDPSNEIDPWSLRDGDRATSCFASSSVNETDPRMESLFQLNGQHRRFITINGQSPGAPIVVPYGAEVIMRIFNNVGAITIHVHGLDKRNLWYADGVPLLQQCAIQPATVYTYRFYADVPGTHWYHGHLGTDRGTGLVGAFIVKRDEEERLLVDGALKKPNREYIFLMQDLSTASADDLWYAQRWSTSKWMYGYDDFTRCWTGTRMLDGSIVGGNAPNGGIMVNGKGWHDQEAILARPWTLPIEIFRIQRGETIRLRLICGTTSNAFAVSVEEHQMTVVAADGQLVQPLQVDMLILYPGERYDVLISGSQAPLRKRFYIMLETMEQYKSDMTVREPERGLAVLEYEDVNMENEQISADMHHSNCTIASPCTVLNCPFQRFPPRFPFECRDVTTLRSVDAVADGEILSNGDFKSNYEEYFINMHFDNHVNGWLFKFPQGLMYFNRHRESEIAKWCDTTACPPSSDNRTDENCRCFYHLNITLGAIVQLTVYNMGVGGSSGANFAHPLHIHGTHYYIVRMGFPEYDNVTGMITHPNRDINCSLNEHCNDRSWADPSWMNGRIPLNNAVDPPFKDTVVVPAGGYVTIRFRAVNPGWFFAHCHIGLHAMGGTAFVLRVGSHEQMARPPDGFPSQCGVFEPPPLKNATMQTAANGAI